MNNEKEAQKSYKQSCEVDEIECDIGGNHEVCQTNGAKCKILRRLEFPEVGRENRQRISILIQETE